MKLKRILLLALSSIVMFTTSAVATIIVDDEKSFEEAAIEACTGLSIGVECHVTFQGGSVGFGVCVEVDLPGGGYLTCQIDTTKLECNNNALGTPGAWLTFGSLGGVLLLLRRRKKALI